MEELVAITAIDPRLERLQLSTQQDPDFGFYELIVENMLFGITYDGDVTAETLPTLVDPSQAPLLHAIANELLNAPGGEYAFPWITIVCGGNEPDMIYVLMPPDQEVHDSIEQRVIDAGESVGYETTRVVRTKVIRE